MTNPDIPGPDPTPYDAYLTAREQMVEVDDPLSPVIALEGLKSALGWRRFVPYSEHRQAMQAGRGLAADLLTQEYFDGDRLQAQVGYDNAETERTGKDIRKDFRKATGRAKLMTLGDIGSTHESFTDDVMHETNRAVRKNQPDSASARRRATGRSLLWQREGMEDGEDDRRHSGEDAFAAAYDAIHGQGSYAPIPNYQRRTSQRSETGRHHTHIANPRATNEAAWSKPVYTSAEVEPTPGVREHHNDRNMISKEDVEDIEASIKELVSECKNSLAEIDPEYKKWGSEKRLLRLSAEIRSDVRKRVGAWWSAQRSNPDGTPKAEEDIPRKMPDDTWRKLKKDAGSVVVESLVGKDTPQAVTDLLEDTCFEVARLRKLIPRNSKTTRS